jgi:hypothetical protein
LVIGGILEQSFGFRTFGLARTKANAAGPLAGAKEDDQSKKQIPFGDEDQKSKNKNHCRSNSLRE